MRVLVLHSDIAADARPDEIDTIVTAEAIAAVLRECGHQPALAAFVPHPDSLKAACEGFDLVFNMVESLHDQDALASVAPAMLERAGIAFTGCSGASMFFTTDKPATKRVLRAAGLKTADWHEAPDWAGLDPASRYIVKAACSDASLGLDDDAIVTGQGVRARARDCARRFGGRWFAERFIDGREFNIALLDDGSGPRVLPLAEMKFVDWFEDRPKIVSYAAKWDENDPVNDRTARSYGCERDEPMLAAALQAAALSCWKLFGLSGYARVDFRIDADGMPWILEVNTNPSLCPEAGYVIAAGHAGYSFPELIETIARASLRD